MEDPAVDQARVAVSLRLAVVRTQPFGGYKQSGIGRELSEIGYNEYLQIKHLWRSTAADRSGYAHFAMLSERL